MEKISVDVSTNKELLDLISQMEGVSVKNRRGKAIICENTKNKKPYGVVLKKRKSSSGKKKTNVSVKKQSNHAYSRAGNQLSAIIAKSTY